MSASRVLVLVLVLTACGSSPRHVGAASAGDTETPTGLFGGSGGGAGAAGGTVTLMGQDASTDTVTDGATEDASADAGGSDGGAESVDAGEGTDGALVEPDAGPVNPQCHTCYDPGSEFPMCPYGFVCGLFKGDNVCLEDSNITGSCGKDLTAVPPTNFCITYLSCSQWLAMH